MERKKMGRPTAAPREERVNLRLTADEMNVLEWCAKEAGTTKTEAIVNALTMLANALREKRGKDKTPNETTNAAEK